MVQFEDIRAIDINAERIRWSDRERVYVIGFLLSDTPVEPWWYCFF